MRLPRFLRHALIRYSPLYRRWIRWRFLRAMRRTEKALGERLLPAVTRAAAALAEWQRAWERPEKEPVDGQA